MRKTFLALVIGAFIPFSALANDALITNARKCEDIGGIWNMSSNECMSMGSSQGEGRQVMDIHTETRNARGAAQDANTFQEPAMLGLECRKATASALVGCDLNQNPTFQTTMALANTMRQKLEQDVGASQAALCSQMGSLAQSVSAAHAAYNAFCTKGYLSCQEACTRDLQQIETEMRTGMADHSDLSAVQEEFKKCKSLAGNLEQAKENLGKYAQINSMKAQACKAQVTNAINPALEKACAINPLSPECMQVSGSSDCSNPNSTDTVCVCHRNPSAPQCAGVSGGLPVPVSTSTAGVGGGGADATLGSLGAFGGTASDDPSSGLGSPLQAAKPGGGEGQSMVRGGAGGGRGGGDLGGGSPGNRGGPGGGGGSGYNAKTISGYGFGGAGGGAGGRGSYGYGSGSYANPGSGYGYGLGGRNAGAANVDLRQFLPGGKMDPSRGLAGLSGPDGITGPNTDIWKKINKRYFSVSPSLLP